MQSRILFILKSREATWGYSANSSGLRNSVRFVTEMLRQHGVDAQSVEVFDNSAIDRELHRVKPTHVILEAFWVVPSKLDELKALHPRIRWIVRNHSEMPFLANEGIAMEWITGYLSRGVEVMCNSPRARDDVQAFAVSCSLPESLVTYGPNFYPCPAAADIASKPRSTSVINIGCFGAIRPLKNHINQAVAALTFADALPVALRFHINASRVEGGGESILKNLRAMFDAMPEHQLVEHDWMDHHTFLSVMRTMDISMQVSFSETFNIVTADAMAQSVPIVASPEVLWIGDYAHCSPTSTEAMADRLMQVWTEDDWARDCRLHKQRRNMISYDDKSTAVWCGRFAST